MEDINNLDEAKILGYFESIESVFLLKLIFLVSFVEEKNGKRYINAYKLRPDAISSIKHFFGDPIFYDALFRGNEELYLNYVEDMVTSLLTSSWNVFEQITKDLTKANYATQTDELSVCYQNNKFQFNSHEKKDIELFYYIRNAIHHYNGAYNAAKDIDHRYAGMDFKSLGHYGEKMDVSIELAWKITRDLSRYTIKAWSNANSLRSAKP